MMLVHFIPVAVSLIPCVLFFWAAAPPPLDGGPVKTKTKTSMSIERLRALRWAGNFYADKSNFDACHTFIMDDQRELAERIEALEIFDRGMGQVGQATEADVRKYVEENS